MRPADVGVDAARMLAVPGQGQVRAAFPKALYLQVPGGLLALTTTEAPPGPLHVRVAALPTARPGCPVLVDATALRVGGHHYGLDAPVWSPRLPPSSSLLQAAGAAARSPHDGRARLRYSPDDRRRSRALDAARSRYGSILLRALRAALVESGHRDVPFR